MAKSYGFVDVVTLGDIIKDNRETVRVRALLVEELRHTCYHIL